MIIDDQASVIAFLESPSTHGNARVDRIDTHASVVFLAGHRAWKLKRAVRYDYLDYSTVERRKAMCEAEVRLNRRTAAAIYRGVVPVTRRPDGPLALGGSGEPVDWVVEMVRFDEQDLFDRRAARGALDIELMTPLASAIVRFHALAERTPRHGGVGGMAWVIDGNASGFAEQGAGILDPAACTALTDAARRALSRHSARLERRRRDGFVRHCHGDLHLRNLVLIEGRPTLFDAVEFNDEIACTDVLYDLAFLLMDLWRRALPQHANMVWNQYLFETLDFDGIPLLPLFLSCRAAVRAKTSVTAAALQNDGVRRQELSALARQYLAMAAQLLGPAPPCVVAIGGLSGSGKSTVARALAPVVGAVPGAVVLRSDEVRKELCGVDDRQRLGDEAYTPAMSTRVYETLRQRAAAVIAGGHAAIVDAVHGTAHERAAIERLALDAGVPFVGLWLDAPEPLLVARVQQRTHDVSDADAAVVRQQAGQDKGAIRWTRIDAALPLATVLTQASTLVRAV